MIIVTTLGGGYREVSDDAIDRGAKALRDYGMAPACGLASAAPLDDAFRTAAINAYLAMGGQDIRQP